MWIGVLIIFVCNNFIWINFVIVLIVIILILKCNIIFGNFILMIKFVLNKEYWFKWLRFWYIRINRVIVNKR